MCTPERWKWGASGRAWSTPCADALAQGALSKWAVRLPPDRRFMQIAIEMDQRQVYRLTTTAAAYNESTLYRTL